MFLFGLFTACTKIHHASTEKRDYSTIHEELKVVMKGSLKEDKDEGRVS